MEYKILNTIGENFDAKAKTVLESLGSTDYLSLTQKELEKIISSYNILLVGLGLNINKEVLDQAKSLKLIATATTGLDHIDLDYARAKDIAVLSLKDENEFLNSITATAELAFGLIIDLLRNISAGFDSVKDYNWQRNEFIGNTLAGKTLGIVGFGRLGKMMAKYGKVFGMEVIGYDPYQEPEVFASMDCRQVGFDGLIAESDIVSIHVHLSDETEGMFNEEIFAQMKDTAVLINTSRGKIVNESDLLRALESKTIAGYATDVLSDEADFSKDLKYNTLINYAKKNKNLIITPHIGGMAYESRSATDIFIAETIKNFLATNY